jgi:hypothetical protein
MFDSTRHPGPQWCFAMLLGAALASATAFAQTRAYLDPLTDAERRLAEGVAREDARVRKLAGDGRVRLVYVELATPKFDGKRRKGNDELQGRYAEVLQYRFDDDSGVLTLVDLEKRAVLDVQKVEGGAVPLTREDLEEAVKFALDSDEVRKLLGREASQYVAPEPSAPENPPYAIRALLVHSHDRKDPCFRHRCVHLFFQQRNAYLIDTAIVDLTERRVQIQRGEGDEKPTE